MKKLAILALALSASLNAAAGHLGDYAPATNICGKFTTFQPSTGAAFALAGTPALSVYKDSSTTQSTTGVTLTASFDSVTGLHHYCIDTSADGTFYSAGSNFDVVITTGTVDSVSVVGSVVGSFSLNKVAALRPATAGRTLGVAADGDLIEVNTLTGNTAQTGDAFARLGAPVGASISADLQVIDQNVDDIETDTADMQPKLGTFPDLGSGATLSGNLEDMRDNGTATFDRSTDSLQAIRDRGDAAWVTGGAGTCPADAVCTTVATAPTTTTFTASAAPNDDTQLDGWAVLFTDNGDADSYCLRQITGVSTGTITYDSACPFTVAASDDVVFLPAFLADGVDVTSWNSVSLATTNPLPNAAAGANGGLPTVDANNRVAGIQGTITTLDGLDTAQDTQHGTTQSAIAALNDLSAAQVKTEVDTALTDIHLDHLFAADYDPASKPGVGTALLNELIESDAGVSRYTVNALENAPSGSSLTDFTANERTAIKAVLGVGNDNATPIDPSAGILDTIRDDTNELQTDWANGGRLDLILDARASQSSVDGLNDLDSAAVQSAAAAALTAYDPPTNTEMNSAFGALNDVTVAEVWQYLIEDQGGGVEARCAMALMMAILNGDYTTSGSTTTFEDHSGTETRMVSTQDATSRTVTITCPTY